VTTDQATASIFKHREIAPSTPPASTGASEAMRKGVERKLLAQGEGGFYSQHILMPPGHKVEPHSHNADELVYVLTGGITMDDGTVLEPLDSAVLVANNPYGFTVGGDGVEFLLVRRQAAKTKTVA
jgi:quercetin dioxygenase-like cupin family protein